MNEIRHEVYFVCFRVQFGGLRFFRRGTSLLPLLSMLEDSSSFPIRFRFSLHTVKFWISGTRGIETFVVAQKIFDSELKRFPILFSTTTNLTDCSKPVCTFGCRATYEQGRNRMPARPWSIPKETLLVPDFSYTLDHVLMIF